MKTLLVSVCALICAVFSVSAQEVRLDSLWVIYGGFGAMTFSPDSKTLLIAEPQKLAGGSGTIRFYDSATGIEKDSIPGTEYYDVRYTPDGKRVVQVGFGGEIKLYNAETYKLEKSINAPQNAGYIDFSTDSNIIVSAGSNLITVVDITEGVVKAVINRPYQYSTGPNKTDYYWNGKVCFSADGKYVIGKYANSLVQWDWKNTPDKPETLFALPNYAILGFSPDKQYFVLQSNYLWDIEQKKQEQIEGLSSYYNQEVPTFASTLHGAYLIVTKQAEYTAQIIDLRKKKVIPSTPLRYAYSVCISPDSNYLSYNYADGMVQVRRINWQLTGVAENSIIVPFIQVNPLPGNGNMEILINTVQPYKQSRIEVRSNTGDVVGLVYDGSLSQGVNTFYFTPLNVASGSYNLVVQYDNHVLSHRFIITK